jgi:hypothetical protein
VPAAFESRSLIVKRSRHETHSIPLKLAAPQIELNSLEFFPWHLRRILGTSTSASGGPSGHGGAME